MSNSEGQWADTDNESGDGRPGREPEIDTVPRCRRKRESSKYPSSKHSSRRVKRTRITSHSWNGSTASQFTMNYVLDILHFSLHMLRRPLSIILVGYLVMLLLSYFYSTLGKRLLNPICHFPIVSRLALCHPKADTATPHRADYSGLGDIQVATFDELLDGAVSGARLGLEMKKAEIATSDLAILVQNSQLGVSESLGDALIQFGTGAKSAGRGLQAFGAKVGGAVDRIIAMNDYTLAKFEQEQMRPPTRTSWFQLLAPFARHPHPPQSRIISLFSQGMAVLGAELHGLILAADSSVHDLDQLEEDLRLVHTVASLEQSTLQVEKEALLGQLWTILGGNRFELRMYNSHLDLLDHISDCRKHALAHVIGTLQTLQGMVADLEALRERVNQPLLVEDKTPLEVHIKSISSSVTRLLTRRTKAKLLEDAHYAVAAAAPFRG